VVYDIHNATSMALLSIIVQLFLKCTNNFKVVLTIRQANDSVHACLGKIYTIFSNAIFHLV